MRQSNLYVILYTAGLTVFCGILLSMTAIGLKDRQQSNIELEKKLNILSAAVELSKDADIESIYSGRVNAYVIDSEGKKLDGLVAENIDIRAEYKKPLRERQLPVFEIGSEKGSSVEFVVLPLFGFGLWDNIWGYVALESDFNTIKGVKFDHKGETPGLGARITTEEIQARFVGKKIFDSDKLVSVQMMKGEGNDYASSPHQVDGMSGATITGKGLSNMLQEYFGLYLNFINSKRNNKSA